MSEKKSLLVDKSKMPLAMGLAFVAFTTQFGGDSHPAHRSISTLLITVSGV